MIDWLMASDPRGMETLVEHYAPPIYGMVIRMHGCGGRSGEILQGALARIAAEIAGFSHTTSFFTWAMHQARRHSMSFAVSPAPQPAINSPGPTAFTLVVDRGYNICQAATFLGVSTGQVALDIRRKIKQRSAKLPIPT